MSIKDMKFLVCIAKQAERYTKKIGKAIEKKANDYVTEADLAVEKFLINKIKDKYPTHDIVSEETMSEESNSKNYFTIDPIDGTNNFAVGIPLWAIQIAKIDDGKIVASVVYVPRLKECFCASRGHGAFLNGQKLPISKGAHHIIMTGRAAIEYQRKIFKNITVSYHTREFGTAAMTFAYLAAGRGIASVGLFSNIRIWDILPGQLLVEEAGGAVLIEENRDVYMATNEQVMKEILQVAKAR